MKKSLLFRIVVIVIAFLGSYSVARAQVTTSSISGTVKDAKGPMPGASVRAVHVPTGTVYGITTNNDGRFTLGNARVGGPYTIEVSFVGYAPQKFDNVFLRLGEPYVLNVTISDNASNLNEVTIRGTQANSLMSSNRSGSSTVLTRATIQNLPSISRSVNDLTRLTPQANGQAIGGGNYRANNFSVDGANFNNQFGIGQNVPANGSPISIDALEQISINVTPYDVRQSGFTGGSINAVTRSGTNKFFGTAFFTTRGEEQQGKRIGDYKIPSSQVQSFDEKNYGFSFGGPIIKDKLFFFINAEKQLTTSPGTSRIAATPGLPYGSVSTVTATPAAFMDQVKSYLLNNLGYDPGIYQGYSNVSNNEKLFARLDWNISKNHRFSVRYNQVESQTPSSASTSVSGSAVTGNLGYGNVRSGTTQDAGLPFSNSNYATAANLYSGVAELNSTFGSRFTNVLRATYSHQNDPRTSESALFPLVDILDGTQSATSAGKVLTTFGYEPFTYGNLRDVKTYTYSDDLSIALGRHNLTLGAQAEYSTTQNGFQRFGTGFYTFASWEDFQNRATVRPLQYSVTYPLTADGSQAFPSFKFAQYSAYLQDEFNVSDGLKLTAGLRIEQATFPDVSEIKTHPLVLAQTFANGEQINTGALPDAKMTFSPRFGFNWDVSGDRSLVVRGGSGIFTGRVPFVWIVAQSGDAGLLQYTQTYSGANTPLFNPSIAPNLTGAAPAAGVTMPSTLSAISPNLKFPQTWKSSLAVDVKLPLGLVGTLEGIYGKDLNVAFAKNVNLKDPVQLNNPASADNRPFFASTPNARQYVNTNAAGQISATGTTANNVIEMVNAKGGYNWQATAQLTKNFSNGVGLMVAYTRSDQRNFGDQSGDQLLNLWSIPQTSTNPNTPTLSYSGNLNPDRIIANISYRKEYLGNLATSFSLFYEGSQQGRFSYTYSADFNRDGQTNDLIYIPRDASEITFVPLTIGSGANVKNYSPEQQNQIFQDYINQDDYLSKHRGEYAKRNAGTSPWRNQFDLRIVQEVFKNIGNNKNSFQFTADIFNVGNLLSRNWGNRNFVNNASILVPQNVALISDVVKPTFKMAQAGGDIVRSTFGTTQTMTSTYYMQFGVRYNFN
jgi:hypothetical protein